MSKKQNRKKAGKSEVQLSAAEYDELEIILDRLSVQNPAGESFQSLLMSLRSSLMGRESLVLALIEHMARNISDVSFQAFLRLQDLVQGKNHRRMVKQIAYRFAQRGFALEKDEDAAERVVVLSKEVRLPVAHMVPADNELWFVSAFIPDSKFYMEPVCVAVYCENQMRSITVREVEGVTKRYRDLLQVITRSHVKPCEIPMWHAARLTKEMTELCCAQPPSPEVLRVTQSFEPYGDPQRMPYVYELMPDDEEASRGLTDEETGRLLSNINVSALLFRREELSPHRQKILQIEQSVLQVPLQIQEEERALDLTRAAADELCAGKTRRLYHRFFEEQAMWLKLSSSNELAQLAWRTARSLSRLEKAGESSVVFYLTVLSFRHHWPEDFEGAEEAGKDDKPFRETSSGLILPR